MPFKVPPGTKTITEMAPTKSNDRILPITEEALPYFLRQFDLIARQKALTEAGGGVYYDNKLFIAKPDGSPQRRDRMSANFGQLIRHLEMPHIRFHDLRHTAAMTLRRHERSDAAENPGQAHKNRIGRTAQIFKQNTLTS